MATVSGTETAPPTDDEREPAPHDVLTPIPGAHLDDPPQDKPDTVEDLEEHTEWVTVGWRMVQRFRVARGTLLAGGTAYYAFLAMFSLLALAYGLVSLISADEIAEWMTDGLENALPGLVGDDGIDPQALERVGRTSSIVGLLVLAYSGSAVMVATSHAIHQIYGAPPDGRNFVELRLHLFRWLALLGPLVLLSYTLSTATTGFGRDLLDEIGLQGGVARVAVLAVATVLTFALDVGIMFLLLSRLGGIGPSWRAVLTGAVLGAVVIGILKVVMASIISWSVDKPQYGSFAVPIAILVVLWLQALALYGAASLTAAVAETRVWQRHAGPSAPVARQV